MSVIRPKTKKGKLALFLLVILVAAGLYYYFFYDESKKVGTKDDPHADTIAANNLNCGLSVPTDENEYYISGTRNLKKGNLNYADLEGERVRIVGYVYGGPSKNTKISNAKVEIWQADSMGTYHPPSEGKAGDFNKNQLALRGTVRADEFGYFEFSTIYPGALANRARHIHIKASANNYEPVTTQLVMSRSGDFVSVNDDSVAQELPNCNVMNFGAVNGVQTAGYDFHLPELSNSQSAE